jgi:ABC-type histidine transport system ATPase subunit
MPVASEGLADTVSTSPMEVSRAGRLFRSGSRRVSDMPQHQPVIRVEDLHKSFGPLKVLRGISFDVPEGAVLSLIGASGSGKSTLLRCINLLEQPSSGAIYLNGEPVGFRVDRSNRRSPDSPANVARIRAKIGMVFQQFNLWPHMTVLQNVIEGLIQVKRLSRPEAREIGREFLRKVNLLEKQNDYPARLSGGQQQRVAIARALAMRPKVMLFDEATSALDPELTGEVLEVMRALADEGTTMLIVTHEMGFAREISNRVLFLHNGQIEVDGTPELVFGDSSSERCQRFLASVLH